LASGLNTRVSLDVVRNRQYAADAGVEASIAAARAPVAAWAASTEAAAPAQRLQTFLSSAQCGTNPQTHPSSTTCRSTCTVRPAPALHSGFFQYNVIFSACTDSACSSTPIIRAEVNFVVASGSVTNTYVESWSVNT